MGFDWKAGIETAPKPRRGTRARVVTAWVNGMRVYRVIDFYNERQLGPDCFSWDEVETRLDDIHTGRKVVWLNGKRFTRKRLSSSQTRSNGDEQT